MAALRIVEILPGATIQDGGRRGWRRYGVTVGGAIDAYALAEGQALLGNDRDAAALELFAFGGKFHCCGDLAIATSGARMDILVNRQRARWRSIITLRQDDLLEIGQASRGVYGYLHLPGGIDCPEMLGSKSTHAASGLGWTPQAGEFLRPTASHPSRLECLMPEPGYFADRVIRVMDTPQSDLFSDADRKAITEREFVVSARRNRMGIGLESGNFAFEALAGLTLASDAIVPGDIQVSGDGSATVLMADSQPVGGYPRLATVITADRHRLAQIPSGDRFRMVRVGPERAVGALKAMNKEVLELAGRLDRSRRDPSRMDDLLSYSLISGVTAGDDESEN